MGLSGLNQGSVQIQVIELARSQHALEDIERIWVKVRDVSWNPMNFPQFCCFWEARFRSAYGLVAISAVLAKLRLPHRGGNSDLSSCSGDAACTAHVIAIAQGAARPQGLVLHRLLWTHLKEYPIPACCIMLLAFKYFGILWIPISSCWRTHTRDIWWCHWPWSRPKLHNFRRYTCNRHAGTVFIASSKTGVIAHCEMCVLEWLD